MTSQPGRDTRAEAAHGQAPPTLSATPGLAEIDQQIASELTQSHQVGDTPMARRCQRIARAIALGVAALGVALAARNGWLPDAAIGSDAVLGLACAAAALLLQVGPARALAVRLLAGTAALGSMAAGTLAIAQHLAWTTSGLEHWLAQVARATQQGSTASMHPLCAIALVLCGAAILLLDTSTRRRHAPAEYLALSIVALNLVPLIGSVYQADAMRFFGSSRPVPWALALALLGLGIAILLARPSRRLMAIITDRAPGGEMLRKSLPQTLLVLVALNWLVNRGAQLDWYPPLLVSPLLTLLNSSVILVIFWRTASKVNDEYRARLGSASALAEATSLLIAVSDNTDDPIFVKDCAGRLIFANPATLRRIGKTREQALSRTSRELFIDPDEADRIDADDQRILHKGCSETLEQTLHLPHGVRTYATTKAPWIDASGTVRGIIGISTDISARKEMERQLKQREAELETTIAQRTAALRKLADHLETVREEEKRAIARELHDDMGASLTSLNMHLTSFYKMLPDEPKWADRAVRVQALVAALVATTRRIQIGLRPIMLDLFGLKAGITEQIDEFAQRTGMVCKTSLPDEDVKLPHKLEITLYRMLQEALNNVAKHAQASSITVVLDVDEDGAALTVRDDGIGIASDRLENQTTYGIRGLAERASFLGGTARVYANPDRGTTVRIELPTAQ